MTDLSRRPGYQLPFLTIIIGEDNKFVEAIRASCIDLGCVKPTDDLINAPVQETFIGPSLESPAALAVLAKHNITFDDVCKDYEAWIVRSYGDEFYAELIAHHIRQLGVIDLYDRILIHGCFSIPNVDTLIDALSPHEKVLVINLQNLKWASESAKARVIWLPQPTTAYRLIALEREIGKN